MWKLRLGEVELVKSHSRAQKKSYAFSELGHMFKVLEHKYVLSRNPWAKNISEVVVLVQNPRQVPLSTCFPRTTHYSNTAITIFANVPWISQRVINKHININIKSTIRQFWKNTKVTKCQLRWPWFSSYHMYGGDSCPILSLQNSGKWAWLPSFSWSCLALSSCLHWSFPLCIISLTHMWPSLFFWPSRLAQWRRKLVI